MYTSKVKDFKGPYKDRGGFLRLMRTCLLPTRFSRILLWCFMISIVTLLTFGYLTLYRNHTRPRDPLHRSLKSSTTTLTAAGPMKRTLHLQQPGHKVLLILETQLSKTGQQLRYILEAYRVPVKVVYAGKQLPYVTRMDKGKFRTIMFESVFSYFALDYWTRQNLHRYCKQFNVGLITFLKADEALYNNYTNVLPFSISPKVLLKEIVIHDNLPLINIVKAGSLLVQSSAIDSWSTFILHNPDLYHVIASAHVEGLPQAQPLVVYDHGLVDGVDRVLFACGVDHWLMKLILIDILTDFVKVESSLTRYIQIDIDDIFVGRTGIRMKRDDVTALLTAQDDFARHISNFQFTLGFSGAHIHRGSAEEDLGDDMLISNRDRFRWFCHMHSHLRPHLFDNVTELIANLQLNKDFAKQHKIPVDSHYAVSPHHSGIYPIHEQLYEAWKAVWDVWVTSTEEYPHLRPMHRRRGFIYRGIQVLPRQTCGLYTHTIFMDKYPGGRKVLDESIEGGVLFDSLLFNHINIFMTHLSNYGNDRLAIYTFDKLLKFATKWTNLKFQSIPPVDLAAKYFALYPAERFPVWQNPCNDKRHLEIWSESKNCDRLPNILVIGPQKTGSTALYKFLSLHPSLSPNLPSETSYEELQFFSQANYFEGLDWYMQYFPDHINDSVTYFEKSANYFDSESAPMRSKALLPNAKLICILVDPARRAYSWYQHQRAHGERLAVKHSFFEVISATDSAPRKLRMLKSRCLDPGLYAHHIVRWLHLYSHKGPSYIT